jgi:hypothetical protein
MSKDSSAHGTDGAFPPTQWTLFIEAASEDPKRSREALEKLCTTYRRPIVNWFKRHDFRSDPEDLTQEFLAYLLRNNLFSKVAPRTGLFRCFLATAMRYFLRDTWDKANAAKRGEQFEKVPLVERDVELAEAGAVDSHLDVDLALEMHQRVMAKLEPDQMLAPYIFQKDASEGWDSIAARLNRTTAAVRKEVSRLRRRHWECFRDEVAQTATPADRAEETRYLYGLLFKNLPAP